MRGELRRILMTADAVGGVWTYALDLISGLAPAGVEVVLATMGPEPSAAQVAAASAQPNLRLVTSTFKLEWMDAPWEDVARAGTWLLDLETEHAPDVVHLNGYAHAALPFRSPTVVVGHSCMLSWNDAIPDAIDPARLAEYRAHVQAGVSRAGLIVAPSRAMADALQRHYGPRRPVRVIHNSRRPGIFAPGTKEPFILSVGRLWDRAKNVEAVADVAPHLRWPTAIAGPQHIDDSGRPIARPGVRMLGVLDERTLSGWMARASIFALPARYEPFGLAALEAALSGCALVLGDIPSLREIWGHAAEYVPPDDARSLERTLAALIASPVSLRERAEAARQHAAGYSMKAMILGYLTAYRDARDVTSPESDGAISCAS